jgi:excisionase family DNA binding protein
MAEQITKNHLTVAEVAIELDVSACTVRRWAKAGKLRAIQPGGQHGTYRFPLDCIEQSQVSPNPATPKNAANSRLSGPKPKWQTDST